MNRLWKFLTAITLIMMLLLTLSSCEDTISPVVEEKVRLAALPMRSLTILPASDGSVAPEGTSEIKDGEPYVLSAQADAGFSFYRWEKVSGTGTVTFDDENAEHTSVRLTGGDATIKAVIDDNEFTVTVSSGAHGTVNISAFNALQKGVQSVGTATATPDPEYNFQNWTVTAGAGITFTPAASSATINVTASAGDATIRANFVAKTYTLTVNYAVGGYAVGGGTVTSGIAKSITAYPNETYLFDGWTKIDGAGTATFGNAALAATTVTVTGGNVTVQANFRKEALTLSETGSLGPLSNTTTNPEDLAGAYLDYAAGFLYVTGANGQASTGVIRRVNLSSPAAPTLDASYTTTTGTPVALVSDGAYLYAGTNSRVLSYKISNFPTLFSTYSVSNLGDLAIGPGFYPNIPSYLLLNNVSHYYNPPGLTLPGLTDFSKPTIGTGGDFWISDTSFDITHAIANGYGIFAVLENNGANLFAGYEVDGVSGSTLVSPTSSYAPHNGADQYPGEVGRPVFQEDQEWIALPVQDENGNWFVQIYDSTDPNSVVSGPYGTIQVGGPISDLSWQGSYIYAAGSDGVNAVVWVIDAYTLNAPVIRKSLSISGFTKAEYAITRNNYLWVVLYGGAATPKLAIKSYSITRN